MTRSSQLARLALGTLMPGFDALVLPAYIEQAYAAGLRSVCLYGDNVATPDQLASLCADIALRMPGAVVAVDEEGGDVTRLHYRSGSPQPGNALLGRLDDPAATRRSAASIGAELGALGIGLDLAPVVDVNSADENPVIGVRSFGADPSLVARHTTAWVEGLQATGVAACAKHFPGHGDTTTDSHLELPRVDAPSELLRDRELVPFAAAVAAGVAAVMTSHIVVAALDPGRPATFSPVILGDLLRGALGFEGVIVTDALDMAGASARTGIPEAAVRAIAAGADLLCLGTATTPDLLAATVAALVDAVDSGRVAEERLADAASRVARLTEHYAIAVLREVALGVGDPAPSPDPRALAQGFARSTRVDEWLRAPGPIDIVQVDTAANQAVGEAPWGPAALGRTTAVDAVAEGTRVAVVGRGLSADHPARALARTLEAAGHETLLVECGWPRGEADIVTFGASAVVARALCDLLDGPEDTAGEGSP